VSKEDRARVDHGSSDGSLGSLAFPIEPVRVFGIVPLKLGGSPKLQLRTFDEVTSALLNGYQVRMDDEWASDYHGDKASKENEIPPNG